MPREPAHPSRRPPRPEPIDRLGWELFAMVGFVLGVTLMLLLVVLGLV
jgi:hypothetical protein